MKKYKSLKFYEEDAGGSPALEALGDVEETPTETPEVVEGDETPEPKEEAPKLDAASLATAFATSLKEAGLVAQPKATEEKPLTPEEAKKLMNVWEPSDEWLAKYDNLETRKVAIAEQRDAMMKQFDTVAQVRLRLLEQQLEAKFGPIATQVMQQDAEARQTRFQQSYPQLKDKNLAPVISAVATQLKTQGQKFQTEKDMFKAIAEGTAAVIRASNPEFKLISSDTKVPASSKSEIPVTTGGHGGGGGQGKGGGGTPVKGRALAILGDVGS